MNARLEMTKAFCRALWPSVPSHPAPDGPLDDAESFEAAFAERNVLGVSLEDARRYAERELAGEASPFPGYSFGFSTGSTGQPGVFLTSERERAAWVGSVVGKFLPWRLLLGCDVALILKHNNRLYTDAGATRRIRLHYFSASEPVRDWAGRLCAVAPQVLIGPPSVLEQVAHTKAFESRPLRPQLLLAGAEPLFPQDDRLLRDAYGIAPRVIYQAKEGFLAAGCPRGSLHLNEDLVHFEWLNLGAGRVTPIITDLTRTSQTYRRYRLDDVLIASGRTCECARPFTVVDAVEGRAEDVVLLPSGRRVFPLEINAALGVHDFQLTQVAPDAFTLAGGSVDALAPLLGSARIDAVPFRALALGEKRRRVRRLFDGRNEWLKRIG